MRRQTTRNARAGRRVTCAIASMASSAFGQAACEVEALVSAAQAIFDRLQEAANAGEGGTDQLRESVRALSEAYDTRLQTVAAAAAQLDGERDGPPPAAASARSIADCRRERDELVAVSPRQPCICHPPATDSTHTTALGRPCAQKTSSCASRWR